MMVINDGKYTTILKSLEKFYSKNYRESLFQLGRFVSRNHVKHGVNILLDAIVVFLTRHAFFSRSAPNPSKLASIFDLVGQFGETTFRMAADVIKFFNFSIASNWGFCKLKTRSFFKSAPSGVVTSVRFGMNLPR